MQSIPLFSDTTKFADLVEKMLISAKRNCCVT